MKHLAGIYLRQTLWLVTLRFIGCSSVISLYDRIVI
jgi:hypothetical protein